MDADKKRDKQRKSLLKKIDKLRERHTELFNAQDTDPNCWSKMHTITGKIIMYWDQYHRLG